MTNLKGKKILMFSPFGSCKHYTDGITEELIKRGATVKVFDERPSQKAWVKIYMNLFKSFSPKFFTHYIERTLATLNNENYYPDFTLIIRGQGFDSDILKYIREKLPNTKLIFFQWDPLGGKNISEKLQMYDRAFSFDPEDVRVNKEFIFRPTFYLKDYEGIADQRDNSYDVVFVGTIYNNRWSIIQRIKSYLTQHNIRYHMHLYMASWTLFLWDFIFKGLFVNPQRLNFKMMDFKDNVQKVKESKAILDIVYSKQSGLSMRAYEALASKRKYITNNEHVKDYDFYNESNILIIDTNHLNIPSAFLNSPFQEIDNQIKYKYSLSGFVDDIFEDWD